MRYVRFLFKRWFVGAVLMILTLGSFYGVLGMEVCAEETDNPVSLYVIYDNSKSMKSEGNAAWRQVAYAIETMAAMMGDKDKLTIYFMEEDEVDSDHFEKAVYDRNLLSHDKIMGELHEQLEGLNYTDSTYVDGLEQALYEIEEEQKTMDNVQLLILSDGAFNSPAQSMFVKKEGNDYYTIDMTEYEKKFKVFYLGIKKEHDDSVIVTNDEYTWDGNILSKFTTIGNSIYDRQLVDYEMSGDTVSFELELPVKRLIVMAQTTGDARTDVSLDNITGGMKKTDSVSYGSLDGTVGEQNAEGIYHAVVNIYEPEGDSAIAPGRYSLSGASGAEIFVYAEYDVQYMIRLVDKEGKVLIPENGDTTERFREGSYIVEIGVVNTLSGEYIQEASIYDRLQVKLKLDGTDWNERTMEGVWLSEGKHSLTGTLSLADNYAVNIDTGFDIGHQLGNVEFQTAVPENGFDIDALTDRQETISVQLLEDGENISDLEGLELTVENGLFYQYEIQKVPGGWNLYPVLQSPQENTDRACAGEFEITIGVNGQRDGQPIDVTSSVTVTYYAQSGQIRLNEIIDQRNDVLSLLWNPRIVVEPYLVEAGTGTEWVTNIGFNVTEVNSQEGGRVNAEVGSDEPLRLVLKFDTGNWLTAIWKFRNGGVITGRMEMTFDRYGIADSAVADFEVEIGSLTRASWIILALILAVAILLIWTIFVKLILGNRFWGTNMMVQCITYYGETQDTICVKVKRQRLKNLFRLFNPQIVISLKSLQYLGFSAEIPHNLVIERQIGGYCVVKNMREFLQCAYVRANGKELTGLDKGFEAREGMEWTLLGERETAIKITFER